MAGRSTGDEGCSNRFDADGNNQDLESGGGWDEVGRLQCQVEKSASASKEGCSCTGRWGRQRAYLGQVVWGKDEASSLSCSHFLKK